MDILLDEFICEILNLQQVLNSRDKIMTDLGSIKECFGVFVSIKRGHKLITYPYDIYGCLGYWNKDYKPISVQIMYDKLNELFTNILNKQDSRSLSFPTPIESDSQSEIELYFMMLPLEPINLSVNSITEFDNTESGSGLIVKNNSGNTATFLPGVFNNEKQWNEISKQLKEKAGIFDNTAKFVSYKAHIYKKKIIDIINSYTFSKFVTFINNKYTTFVPYETIQNQINIDETQIIRNLAVMKTLLDINNYSSLKLNQSVITNIESNISFYTNEIKNNDYQSLANLLLLKNKDNICEILANSLTRKDIDYNFELGQILITMKKVCNIDISKYILLMFEQLRNIQSKSKTLDINIIFRLNWQTQALLSQKANEISKPHIKLITDILIKWINKYKHKLKLLETNYIAVCFECLCYLCFYYKSNYYKSLYDSLLLLFVILQNRQDNNGLYKFNNGNSRLDITSHIINGILHFTH